MLGTLVAFGAIPPFMAFWAGFIFFRTFQKDEKLWEKNIQLIYKKFLTSAVFVSAVGGIIAVFAISGSQNPYAITLGLAVSAPLAFIMGAFMTMVFPK